MTTQTEADLAALARNVDELRGELRRHGAINRGTSSAEIHVNAGGVGVWIATSACLVMLAASLLGSVWLHREFTRIDSELIALRTRDQAQQAYLNAIYQQVPALKPKTAEEAAK